MVEYTWDDVIVNPNDTRLEGAIGKYVYYAITPFECIRLANNNNIYSLDRLEYIQKECDGIFIVGKTSYPCIIIKKEEPKEYVTFESADEFLTAYENSKYNVINVTTEKQLISCGGIWLKSKCEAIWITQCTEVADHGIVLGLSHEFILWKELLNGYRFLDGSPCGKKKE